MAYRLGAKKQVRVRMHGTYVRGKVIDQSRHRSPRGETIWNIMLRDGTIIRRIRSLIIKG